MSKFSDWQVKPEHVRDFHIGNALCYADLAYLLVRAVMTAPAEEFTEAEREVLGRFVGEGLDDRRWAVPSRPQDF